MENNLLNFRVSTHIKDIIGRDLVTDKYVAIFELVKNSVDADAQNIEIFISDRQIVICDDGKGMTLNDLQNKWFFIGYSEKKGSKELYAGSKGIGRFSADNLAKKLHIKTKSIYEDSTINIAIEWENFEQDQRNEINEISIPYTLESDNSKTGTTLILTELRSVWSEKDIEKLKSSLEKLENPFEENRNININLKSEYTHLDGMIHNRLLEVLNEKSIFLNVTIKDSFFYCELTHNGNLVTKFSYYQKTILENVSFKIYHLNRSSKINFTRKMGTDFKNYGTIFIYRNGFRVYPYGEVDYDTFQLNIRKTQGYNRFLGLRDIIGSISITDSKNNFKEVSSRDNGFVTNQSYLELENIYMEYHRFLEDFMVVSLFNTTTNYDINEKTIKRFIKKDSIDYTFGKSYKYVDFNEVLKKIENDLPLSDEEKKVVKDEKVKTKLEIDEAKVLKKENKALQRKNFDLEKEISIKNIIINSNDDVSNFSKEMFNHHINSEIRELKSIINKLRTNNEELLKTTSFIDFEKSYYEIINKLNAIKNIVFIVGEKSIGKSENNIVHFIKEYSTNWSRKNNMIIDVFTNNLTFIKNYAIIYLVIILDNLFDNARKTNAHKIEITFDYQNDILAIDIISRNSVNTKIDLDKVFDFGYTTNKRSTGMGMYFVKKLSEKHLDATVSAEILNEVDFVTCIKMR